MKMGNEVIKAEVKSLTVTPSVLLERAVEQGADLDKLEKLMDLQDRWDANQARNLFSEALGNFQAELGPIIKRRQGHNCKYADLDDIAQEIRPILEKFGLSYQFRQSQEAAMVNVTCIVRHLAGHTEENSLGAPNDSSGGKNAIQSIASTVTYLRRYTLTGALGITTGTEDNDGGKPSIDLSDLLKYIEVVRDEFPSIAVLKESLCVQDYSQAKEAWMELGEETQRILWRAPSKGGILTTNERSLMKSNEWTQA